MKRGKEEGGKTKRRGGKKEEGGRRRRGWEEAFCVSILCINSADQFCVSILCINFVRGFGDSFCEELVKAPGSAAQAWLLEEEQLAGSLYWLLAGSWLGCVGVADRSTV